MNNFPYAFEPLKKTEGGYVNDPADPGGETYAGISRVANPSWEGWKILDSISSKMRGHIFPALDTSVAAFYYNEYWLKNKLDGITDKDVATAALDTVVNHGKGPYLLQQALQKLGQGVAVDGRIGPDTLAHINSTVPKNYLGALYEVRKNYYKSLVANDPRLERFLDGWLARIDKWKLPAASGLFGLAALLLGAIYYFSKKKIS